MTNRVAVAVAGAVRRVGDRVRRRRLRVRFYNLQVSRPHNVVAREVRALLAGRTAVLGLCEATGYDLPLVPGYRLLRDTSSKSRANIAAYVRDDLPVRLVRWHDLAETWGRTKHPGVHEPRSFLEFDVGRWQVVIGHQGPKFTNNTEAVQTEGVELVVRRMAPWRRTGWARRSEASRTAAHDRPRSLWWDGNRTRRDTTGPGPAEVAHDIGGWVLGAQIDHGVVTGDIKAGPVEYRSRVDGVVLESDHKAALCVTLSIPARWLRAPKPTTKRSRP